MPMRKTNNLLLTAISWLPLTCISLAPARTLATTQEVSQPFSLLISGPEKPLKAGESCDVSVRITNITDKPISLRVTNGEDGAYKDFNEQIESEPSGTVLKPIPIDPRRMIFSQHSSFRFKILQPNESMSHTIHLCKLFDLSAPGTYQVQLKREIPEELGTGAVQSNVIELHITQ